MAVDLEILKHLKGDIRSVVDRLGLAQLILTDDGLAEKGRKVRGRAQVRWLIAIGSLDVAALAVDRLALGESFQIGLALRFGLVLPLILGALALQRWTRLPSLQSAATGIATIAFVAMITALGQYAVEPFPSRYMLIGQWLMFTAIIFAGLPWLETKVMAIVSCVLFSTIAVTSLTFEIVPVNIDLAVLCVITSGLALSIRRRKDLQLAELLVMRRIDNARELELRRANDNLSLLSRTDALTGVFNRRYLDEYIKHVSNALVPATSCGVLMIDVDHFKLFNDTAGHAEGDRCLRAVAQALRNALRSADETLVRYGGEEFAVILPDTDLEQTIAVGERLRCAVSGLIIRHPALGSDGRISVSIGAYCAASPAGLTDALARADSALYGAKQAGRNRVMAGEASPVLLTG